MTDAVEASEGKRTGRIQISLSDEELRAIDEWRFELQMPSRAAAIRQLINIGLERVQSRKDLDGDPLDASSRQIGVLKTPLESKKTSE